MNTVNKQEWRLVPVDATEEVIDALRENGAEGTREQLASDYKVGVLAAPTLQSSEPGVWLIEHTYRNQTTIFTTHHPEDIQQYLDRPELYKVIPFYDHGKPVVDADCRAIADVVSSDTHKDEDGKYQSIVLSDERLMVGAELFDKPQPAKPCERCAELEAHVGNMLARIHRDGGHYQSMHGTDKALADADIMVANAYAKLAAFEAENARLTKERNEALLIHQTDTGTESAVAALQNTVEKQAEQLAAMQKNAERYRWALIESPEWTFAVCKWDGTDWLPTTNSEEIDAAIAAQKEGK